MSDKNIIVWGALALFIVSCAKSPESIQPQYVSNLQYRNLDCQQLAEELARNERAIAEASQQQREARSNDTVGVILLGLPVSSLSGGNVAAYLARLKGERDALARTAIEKRCDLEIRRTDEIIEGANAQEL